MSKLARLSEIEVFFGGEIDRLASRLRNPQECPETKEEMKEAKLVIADYAIAKEETRTLLYSMEMIQSHSKHMLSIGLDSPFDVDGWEIIKDCLQDIDFIIESGAIKKMWFTFVGTRGKREINSSFTIGYDKQAAKIADASMIKNIEDDMFFDMLYFDFNRAIEIARNVKGRTEKNIEEILSLMS
jgi:hypothetical protein